MDRRGFLGTILALGAAPAIVRAESLMRIVVPKSGLIMYEGGYWWGDHDFSQPFVNFAKDTKWHDDLRDYFKQNGLIEGPNEVWGESQAMEQFRTLNVNGDGVRRITPAAASLRKGSIVTLHGLPGHRNGSYTVVAVND